MIFLTPILIVTGLLALQWFLSNRSQSETDVAAIIDTVTPSCWNFVAMEYCFGILNRTYIVFVTETMISGARVRGPIAVPAVVTDRWRDPYFYPRPDLTRRYSSMNVESLPFLQMSRENFQIPRASIGRWNFESKPKWGMGTVPYSGRLYLQLRDGGRRELILLGDQDGLELQKRLG